MSIIQGVGSGEVSTGFYSYSISNSLRFNGSTSFLARTPSSTGNRKTFTYSCWFKIGDPSEFQVLLGAGDYDGGAGAFRLVIGGTGRILLEDFDQPGGSYNLRWNVPDTQMVLLDRGSWYNAVLSIDTTPSTPVIKLFINGTDITSQFTNKLATPSQNDQLFISISGEPIRVGYDQLGNKYHNGYLQECVYLDGTAVSDASDFGEIKGDIWIPKNYSGGSFGTNGFRLEFKESGTGTASASTVGADTSGNNNHMTSTDIASTDQMSDSCTNNHATLGAQPIVTHTLSDGNLKSTNSSGTHGGTTATFNYPTSGKWYHEVTINAEDSSGGNGVGIGNQISRTATNWGNYLNLVAYLSNGNKFIETGATSYGTGQNANNIVGVAFDADNQTLEFYLATSAGQTASSQGTIPTSEMDGVLDFNNLCPLVFGRNMGQTFNFGQSAFNGTDGSGTLPTGFAALNTANLADPEIDPNDDETPDQYMDTVVYTPNNGTLSVTGLEFQPDFVWIKDRTTNIAHALFDVIRGTASAGASNNKAIGTNRTDTEGNGNGVLSSFNSDGFTVAGGSSGSNPRGLVNKGTTANDYVAWTWRAGGSGVSNSDGSISSTVSVNTEAGFSIVSYTGTNATSATVGHGLSKTPEWVFLKNRDSTQNWPTAHVSLSSVNHLLLLDTTLSEVGNNGTRLVIGNASTFTVGDSADLDITNRLNNKYIAYCWHSVDGYSKFGKYEGNGSTDGTFVFTGFRPAWVMIKRFDGGSESFNIVDKKRDAFNGAKKLLKADESLAEASATNGVDLFSNGFKLRDNIGNYNTGSADYIYMAFADQPFKYSNAR